MVQPHLKARETLNEFRDFVLKGNAFDLAVGVIIGAAFGGIVTSLVGDIITPPIGVLMGNLNFSDYYLDLTTALGKGPAIVPPSLDAAVKAGHAIVAYGKFINAVINLVIVGAVIFFLVKQVQRLKLDPQKPKAVPQEVILLTEIRDLLAKGTAPRSQDGA